VHAYVFICLRALWRIYVKFVANIDIKILGGGRGVSLALLSAGAVSVCIPFLVYLLPCLLARVFVFFCFKLTLVRSVSPLFTQNTPYGVTIETRSNLSKYIFTNNLIMAHINNTKTLSAFLQKSEIEN